MLKKILFKIGDALIWPVIMISIVGFWMVAINLFINSLGGK